MSNWPSSTRRAASRRRLSKRAVLGSGSGESIIVCKSVQTFPRLSNSCSRRRKSSSLRDEDPGLLEFGFGLDAATREETNAEVGVAEPAASRGEEKGGVRT